eukprot:NODE_555_length_6111_cov_0.400366.p2 type:complete len:579 gc:universal NODE_555_length_6111_cov_0.400366:4278-2542(-)
MLTALLYALEPIGTLNSTANMSLTSMGILNGSVTFKPTSSMEIMKNSSTWNHQVMTASESAKPSPTKMADDKITFAIGNMYDSSMKASPTNLITPPSHPIADYTTRNGSYCQDLTWKWSVSGKYVDGDFEIDSNTVLYLDYYSYYYSTVYVEVYGPDGFYDYVTLNTNYYTYGSANVTFASILATRNLKSIRAYQLKIYGSYYSYITVNSGSLCYRAPPKNFFFGIEPTVTASYTPYPSETFGVVYDNYTGPLTCQSHKPTLAYEYYSYYYSYYNVYGSFNLTTSTTMKVHYTNSTPNFNYYGYQYVEVDIYRKSYYGYDYLAYTFNYTTSNTSLTDSLSFKNAFYYSYANKMHADKLQIYASSRTEIDFIEICAPNAEDIRFDEVPEIKKVHTDLQVDDGCKKLSGWFTYYGYYGYSDYYSSYALMTPGIDMRKGLTLKAGYDDVETATYIIQIYTEVYYEYCSWRGCERQYTTSQLTSSIFANTLKEVDLTAAITNIYGSWNSTTVDSYPVYSIYIMGQNNSRLQLNDLAICGYDKTNFGVTPSDPSAPHPTVTLAGQNNAKVLQIILWLLIVNLM